MFDMLSFVEDLTALKHRQLEQETKAADIIGRILDRHGVPYRRQTYQTFTPRFLSSRLIVDREHIRSIPTSFVSGKIRGKDALMSSLLDAQKLRDEPNINFNPLSKGISRGEHFFVPSLAVAREDLQKICLGERVHGSVYVKKECHQSVNFLVGNLRESKTVVFCHYDSIGPGATDNASGTSILMKLCLDESTLLERALFVIAGNEELSYDRPIYWGHGYRIFERAYPKLLRQARTILCVDSVGNGLPQVEGRVEMVRYGLPIHGLDRFQKKIRMVCGSLEGLMKVYHSDLDTMETVSEKHLLKTVSVVRKLIEQGLR